VRRLVWFVLGVFSAVWVMRRGDALQQQVREQVRERGILGSAEWILQRAVRLLEQPTKGDR
jgi:hypothetical protein